MRILFFIDSLISAGGTERVCSVLASGFAERAGHEVGIVSIYSGSKPFFYVPSTVALYSLFQNKHRFKYIIPEVVWRLRRVLNAFRPDVIINVSIDSMLCWYSLPALWHTNARNITWEHLNANPDRPSRRIARTLAAHWADAVVTLVERDAVNWRERFRPRGPVVAIPNPSPYTSQVDAIYRRDSRIVLAAGHLIHRKGFDLLVQAWQGIAPAIRCNWRLRVVGSGEEEDALRNLVARLGIEDTVDFAGQKKEMEEEYRAAGLFVLSSRAEGLPMVLLEAMSFGLPVVAFDCKTGPAEIVINGKTGLLAPPEDVRSLSQAMSRMIDDPSFRSECALQTLQRASAYSIDSILKKWKSLMDGLFLPE